MPQSKSSPRRWAVRLAGVSFLGVIAWTFSPLLFSEGSKAENLRPELALVPPDAFLFVHLRSGDVWDHELVAKSRSIMMEAAGNKDFPVDPAIVDSVSIVVQSSQSLAMLEPFSPTPTKKGSSGQPEKTVTVPPDAKSSTGTSENKPRFEAEKTWDVFAKKDSKFEVAFRNGDPRSVEPAERDGVKAEIRDKKAVFSHFGELPDQDRDVIFTVTGGEPPTRVDIKITLKKRETPKPLFVADLDRVALKEKGSRMEVGFKNGMAATINPMVQEMVRAEIINGKAAFSQFADSPNEDKTFSFQVTAMDKSEARITVTVKKKVAEKPPEKPPEQPKLFEADRGHAILDNKDGKIEIAFRNGDPKAVVPAEKDGVRAELRDKKAVFSHVGELPDQDRDVIFTVTGSADGKADMQVGIRITVKKKEVPPEKKPLPLLADADRVTLDKKDARVEVGFKNSPPVTIQPMVQEMVRAELMNGKAVFVQIGESPPMDRNFVFQVADANKSEVRITVIVKMKPPEKKDEKPPETPKAPEVKPGEGQPKEKPPEQPKGKVPVGQAGPAPGEAISVHELAKRYPDKFDAPLDLTTSDWLKVRNFAADVRVFADAGEQPQPAQTKGNDDTIAPSKQDGPQPAQPRGIDQVNPPRKQGGPELPDMLVIVATKKPYEQDKMAHLAAEAFPQQGNYKGKSYLINPQGVCLCFAGETLIIAASSEAMLKKALDRPAQVKAEGPQAAALNLAQKKHHLVVGFNFGEPALQAQKKRLAVALQEADRFDDLLRPAAPVWTLLPLLETQTATLCVDLGKESKVRVEAGLTFADAERAAAAAGALQDSLTLARVFTLGRLIHGLEAQAGDPVQRQQSLFLSLLLKQAETALRGATVQRRQATIQFAAEGQFDLDFLRGKAKIAADNFVMDPVMSQAANRRQSSNNLKQMMLAIHNYHDTFNGLPPPAICSKTGTPLLSWRVIILPYIEEFPLYQEFKLDEAWDSPHNIKLLPRMPKVYAPPGVKTKEPYTTLYQVFTGKGAAFELVLDNKEPNITGARGFRLGAGFPDGLSNTIGIVEAADPVPWTKPADLVYDAKKPLPKLGGTLFKDGFHCALMDASVRFITPAMSENTLRNAITRDDGNPPGSDW